MSRSIESVCDKGFFKRVEALYWAKNEGEVVSRPLL